MEEIIVGFPNFFHFYHFNISIGTFYLIPSCTSIIIRMSTEKSEMYE